MRLRRTALAAAVAIMGAGWGSSVVTAVAQVQSAANTPRPAATRDLRLAVARRIMEAARFCTLVTNGPDGRAQARIVDPLLPGAAMEIYFATNPKSRKVSEVRHDRRVTLLYFDRTAMAYVTVIGDAAEVMGPPRAGHYKDDWARFFPREKPGTWALYRVDPTRLEVVSASDGLSGDSVTWRPDRVDFR